VIVPVGHDQSIRRWPYVTIAIIALCTLVQIYAELIAPTIGDAARALAQNDGERALRLLHDMPVWKWGYHTDSGYSLNLFTSAFVHAGWFHLVGNMVFLWVAGSAVEDRIGRVQYAVFYLAGAAAATICWTSFHEGHRTILVGASGAISAVMGAFLVYFAKTNIKFWYWWFVRAGSFEAPAYIALPLWFGEQILWRSLEGPSDYSGVAYEAHIGGFALGFAVALVAKLMFKDPDADPNGPADEPGAPPATDDRLDRCYAAIRARDLGTVGTLASRVMIDLSRAGDHKRILDLYDALGALPKRTLTDGAYAAAVRAADALRKENLRDSIIAELKQVHPGSALAR